MTFEGRYYQLREAHCEPKPLQKPHPPFVIGGRGERLSLRVVARYATIWDCIVDTPEEYRHKSTVLDGHCAAIGRDPTTIERANHVFIDYANLRAAREETRSFVAAGVSYVIYHLPPPYPAGIVRHLAEEVAESFCAEYEEEEAQT